MRCMVRWGRLVSETTAYDPRSPYSASKALAIIWSWLTFTHMACPLLFQIAPIIMALSIPRETYPFNDYEYKRREKSPVYGDGRNVRDWIYVEDHNRAVHFNERWSHRRDLCYWHESEWENIVLLKIIEISSKLLNKNKDEIENNNFCARPFRA